MPASGRAAILRAFGRPHEIAEVTLRDPRPGEVLVRVLAAGVCHSDVGQADGEWDFPLPAVLGHEGCGVVEAVGPGVTNVSVGERVVLNSAPGCGACRHCFAGRPILCQESLAAMSAGRLTTGPSPITVDSESIAAYSLLACFAERVVVAERSVIGVPDEMSSGVGAVLGCAVITGVGAAIETLKVPTGSRGVVIGAGGVGISAILGAQLAGAAAITAVDPVKCRRDTALAFGVTDVLDPAAGEIEQLVRRAPRDGFDWSLVTVGRPDAIELGIEIVRPGGTACIVGLTPQGTRVGVDMLDLVTYERTVIGSAYGSLTPQRLVPRLVELYRTGQLPLDRLVSKPVALEDIDRAFEDSRSATGFRPIIELAER